MQRQTLNLRNPKPRADLARHRDLCNAKLARVSKAHNMTKLLDAQVRELTSGYRKLDGSADSVEKGSNPDDLLRRDRLLMGNLSWEGIVRVKNTEVTNPNFGALEPKP